jgi:hypothetical protein
MYTFPDYCQAKNEVFLRIFISLNSLGTIAAQSQSNGDKFRVVSSDTENYGKAPL